MGITVPSSGIHGTYGADLLENQFPTMQSELQQTGIYGQEVELLDTQRYQVDIYNSWLSHKPEEFPLLSILANLGAGDFISEYMYHWWDEYEGTGLVDTGIDNLRIRDGLGTSAGVPWAIGTAGEIGGKMMWQPCYIATGALTTTMYANAWDTYLANSAAITVVDPATTYVAGSTNMVPYGTTTTQIAEIQETGPVLINSTKKLMSLGFSRSGTNKYSYTVGTTAKYLTQMFHALKANDYVYETFATTTWNGGSAETTHSLKFTEGTSFRCMVQYDNLELATITDHDTLAQTTENVVVVAVDRIIMNDAFTKFILVLDWAESNIEVSANAEFAGSTLQSTETDTWQMVTRIVTTSPTIYDGTTTRTLHVGDVFKCTAAWTSGFTANGCYVATLNTAFLTEEVNTATAVATNSVADRIFGQNEDTSNVQYGGDTRLSRHLIINMFHDTGGSNSESDPFPTTQATGYTFTEDGKYNNITIYNQKPYAITIMRMGAKLRFRDNWATLRERNLSKFRKIWANKILWEKKSNISGSTVDGTYKGTMDGLFSYENFPIKYFSKPLPINGSNVLSTSSYGLVFMEYLDSIAKALNYNATTGKYKDRTLLCSHDVMKYLKNTNAILASVGTGNIFGAQTTMAPPSKLTLGLAVYTYETSYGVLKFVHDPSLDKDTAWKFPRFLFSHKNGLIRPKWIIIAIDKSFIKLKTQKTRPEKIYGNLQSNNNPFVYEEAMSAAHTLEVRNCANHAIIDVTPY